ncbi:helix-turn-helix domain-containing protein [Kocuria koreensis]|jgi:putative transcriptional regulator|uniref:Helix-turn-helix domain-containing protein n=1 Tax=Rothia koreensis TaxID=592378 RepID=A0A7K1LJM2_9MICC|nr:helix-turn-helix transcriptional regulator [Rothia koreensis]MUN55397.1 helix-turn-helix domain-containing protein [Rothia koreensis]
MENRVREYRNSREWSQQHLADTLGVSRQTILSIEKGKYDPSLPLAFQMASVFECMIEDLFLPEL